MKGPLGDPCDWETEGGTSGRVSDSREPIGVESTNERRTGRRTG